MTPQPRINVCRSAFMMLTGLGVPFVQAARAGALNDKESHAPRSEIGAWRRIAGAVWPQKYLDARQWLIVYADKFGSWNPARDRCHLPAGRREFYHAAYVADRVQQGCRPPQDGGRRRRWRDIHLEQNSLILDLIFWFLDLGFWMFSFWI